MALRAATGAALAVITVVVHSMHYELASATAQFSPPTPTRLPEIEGEQIGNRLIDPAIVGAYPTGKSVALTGAAMTSSTGTVLP